MSARTEEEEQTKDAAMMVMVKSEFPATHLAPWMSIHPTKRLIAIAKMKTLAAGNKHLNEQAALLQKPKPEKAEDGEEEEDEEEDEEQAIDGGAETYSFCVENFMQNLHDLMPSGEGIGRKQGMGGVNAQRTGITPEPKKRSLLDKLTGKNKEDKAGPT